MTKTLKFYCVVFALVVSVLMLPALAPKAVAQAVSPSGNVNPQDEPLAGQSLGSSLTLNQGANAIAAENQAFQRFGFGLQASGGAITNFFGTQTDHQTVAFSQIAADGAVSLQSSRTTYFAFYQPRYNFYPQYSDVNSFGQSAYQTVIHRLTDRTGIEWDTTAARYLSLNEFLPQNLVIGGIGIVVPTVGQDLLEDSFELTNAATSLHVRSLLSARMTFDGTLTSGFFLIVPKHVTTNTRNSTERILTSGANLQLTYELSPRDSVGGALTPIYIYGLYPSGHVTAETVQGLYQRQLTSTFNLKLAAGPLFFQSSTPLFGAVHTSSYALNASLSRQLRQSQFSVGYSRAFIVNLLAPAIISNSIGSTAYLPLRRNWILLGDASYTHDLGTKTYGATTIYGGSGQVSYLITQKLQLFARYSFLSESFDKLNGSPNYSFIRNQIGGGIRFNFGNPTPTAFGGIQ